MSASAVRSLVEHGLVERVLAERGLVVVWEEEHGSGELSVVVQSVVWWSVVW